MEQYQFANSEARPRIGEPAGDAKEERVSAAPSEVKKERLSAIDERLPASEGTEPPPYIETSPAATHPGASAEWADPRAGIDLDVAVRSRVARRAVYEARNPPSLVRHLAQAFVGKDSPYTKSTQYTVDSRGIRKMVNASMFVDSAGFLYDFKAPPEVPNDASEASNNIPEALYPQDLRPIAPIGKYRPRGTRSTRLSIREDAQRKWS